MIDRCLKCGVVVGEEDQVCPSCQYDLSLTPQKPEPSKLPPLKKAGPSFVGIPEFMREDARPWRLATERLPKPRWRGGRWAVVSSSVGLFILSFVALRFWRGEFPVLRGEPPPATFIVSAAGKSDPEPPRRTSRRARRSVPPRSNAVRRKNGEEVHPARRYSPLGAGQPVRSAVRSQPAASGVRSVEVSGRGRRSRIFATRHVFHGTVYDLMSLRPVPSARLVLKDKVHGETFSVSSDAQGRFELEIPPTPGGGYLLEASRDGYQERSTLVRDYALVREFSKDKRRRIADGFSQLASPPEPIVPSIDKSFDIWLIPDAK